MATTGHLCRRVRLWTIKIQSVQQARRDSKIEIMPIQKEGDWP